MREAIRMSVVLDKIKGSMLLLPITSVRFYSDPVISNNTITGYTNDLTILYPEQESSYLFTKLGNKDSKGIYRNYGWNFELTVYVPNNNFYKDTTEAQLNGLGYDMLLELKKLMNFGSCLMDLRLGNVPDGSQSLVDETLPMGDQEAPTNINFSLLRKIIIKNGSNPDITIWAVEPQNAAILAGGNIGTHLQMGIGDGIIPENLNRSIYDDIFIVTDEMAIRTSRNLARKEGIMCGISSGTNVAAALELAKKLGKGKTVVTVLPDTAERYFSTPLFDNDLTF